MLAAQCFERSGDAEKVRLAITDKPVPSVGWAVVKVLAAAGNGLDYKVMAGDFSFRSWDIHYPCTLGFEFAGVVDSILPDDEGTSFAVGDKVCGVNWGVSDSNNPVNSHIGAFAEFILFPIEKLCPIPQGVSIKEAAAIGVAGLTALQLLHTCAKITPDSRILILGGSSAVGSLAVQLAKLNGSWVTTTCSSRSLKYVNQFGADQIINYEEQEWDEMTDLNQFDAVIDTVGEQGAFHRALDHSVLGKNGVFVSIAALDNGVDSLKPTSLSYSGFYLFRYDQSQLEHLLYLLAGGKLIIPIDRVFPFSEEGVRSLILYQQRKKSLGKNLLLFDHLATYHGSCACGSIAFEVIGRPQSSLICHCQPCQRLLSGFFSSFCLYPRVNITSGEDLIISFGSALALNRSHFFCRVCGSCLYLKHPSTDCIAVLMFALEDFPFRPTAHVHFNQSRLAINDNLPKHPEWLDPEIR